VADLGTLVVRLALAGEQFNSGLGHAKQAVQSFSAMAGNTANLISNVLSSAVVQFGADAVRSFLEAEKVSNRLNLAVSAMAGNVPGLTRGLEEAADAMERATGVDGGYIKSLEQLALQLRVQPALVERATKAALDWAEATGGSAKQGLMLLTTANAENLEQLGRWGVKVDEGTVKARGLEAVLEGVEKVYGGASSQINETSKGLAAQSAAWGDLKEAIGETLARLSSFTGASSTATNWMDGVTEFLTAKGRLANVEEAGRVEEFTRLRNAEAEAIEEVRQAEMALIRTRAAGEGGVAGAEAALTFAEQILANAVRAKKEAFGLDTSNKKIRLGEVDLSGAQKNIAAEAKAAAEQYERWERSLEKAAAYANSIDARTASLAGQQEAASGQASMGVQAAELQASALIDNMNAEMAKADAALAGATIAADAQGAAAAFEKLYQDARDFAQSAQDAASRAKDALVSRALGSLGKLGGIIQNAAAAAAGGPLAVAASILIDVLTQSETFQRVVATLNGIVKVVADALGQLLEPLLPLVGAVGLLITALVPLAAMLIELAVGVVEPLTPIIVLVATILEALMPVITVLAQAFLMIMNPLMVLAGPVLKGLFDVLKVVALVILHVAKAIGDAWNWIIGAIQSVFRSLADISIFGAHPLGFLDDWADGLESAKVDTDAMAKAISELTGLSYELALAKAKEAQASFENAQATKKLTDLNTPERWKKFLRTGEAADPQAPPPPPGSMPPGSAPPTAPSPGAPPAGGGLPPVLANGPIGGVFDVANDVLSGGRTPGGQSTLGNVLNIVNNVVVNGANSDAVLAEAEQRGYLTNQRAADSSVGTPVRIGPFQLSLG
jgi:hypothetical protein